LRQFQLRNGGARASEDDIEVNTISPTGYPMRMLKGTARHAPDGSYELLTAEHVFHDYQFSIDQKIALPA